MPPDVPERRVVVVYNYPQSLGWKLIQIVRRDFNNEAGIKQGLHNEDFELRMVDGKRTYDLLFDLLEPKFVKFQVSTISRGYDASEYFTKYPGRFISVHVQGWSAETRKITALGQDPPSTGRKSLPAAKTGGIKNYFVEMNLGFMKASAPYLRNLKV